MAWPTTSRQARGYGAAHDRMRARLIRDVMLCEECTRNDRVTGGEIADHIIPKAKGGTDERSNYQLLCKPCSDAKTARDAGRSTKAGGGVGRDGRPTNPDHPWNRQRPK